MRCSPRTAASARFGTTINHRVPRGTDRGVGSRFLPDVKSLPEVGLAKNNSRPHYGFPAVPSSLLDRPVACLDFLAGVCRADRWRAGPRWLGRATLSPPSKTSQ